MPSGTRRRAKSMVYEPVEICTTRNRVSGGNEFAVLPSILDYCVYDVQCGYGTIPPFAYLLNVLRVGAVSFIPLNTGRLTLPSWLTFLF